MAKPHAGCVGMRQQQLGAVSPRFWEGLPDPTVGGVGTEMAKTRYAPVMELLGREALSKL